MSAFTANKPFANKTLRVGRKIRVLQSEPWGGSCSLETHALPFAQKIQSVILRMVSKMHISDKLLELGSMSRVFYRPGCPSRN